jgi:DNA-binding response OmpR family regulator
MAARRAGADNYLIMPFNAITLKAKINLVFGR